MPKKTRVNKSEWIRSQPATVSALDLVKLAKKEGITLTPAQIYTTRSQAKKANEKSAEQKSAAPVAAGKKLGRPRKSNGHSNGHSDLQRDFIRLAVRIGTDQAKQMLDQFVAQQ